MEYKVGNVVQLKKTHPCGSNMWEIVRIGMDIKLRCNKCHKIVLISRVQFRDDLLNKNGDEKLNLKEKVHTTNYQMEKIGLETYQNRH